MTRVVDMASSRALCGYRRLSVDRSGNKIGYEVQTAAGEAWAERTGQTIGHWYEDKNETAADENVFREGYEQMLADVAGGMWGGVVVWRVDRLTRLDTEFLRVFGIVSAAGGHIFSVEEGLTTENDAGVTGMKLRVLLGDSEIRSSKKRISANKNLRQKKGEYSGGGRRPFGFVGPEHDSHRRVTNTGKCGIEHVPHEVALLKDAARRVAWEGQSYLDVISDWHDQDPPIYGATGAPWNTKTLETILTSARMVGKQSWHDRDTGEDTLVDAVWEPVLDERTWKKLVSAKKRAATTYNSRGKYLLTNIIMCGRCKMPLSGSQRTYPKGGELKAHRAYRCPSGAPYKARGHCGKLNVLAEPVEKLVAMHAFVRLERSRGFLNAFAGVEDPALDLIEQLEWKIKECADQIEEIEEIYRSRRIKLDEYLRLRDGVQSELDTYEGKIRSLTVQLEIPQPVGQDWRNLEGWFENGLSLRQQRLVIEAHIQHAEVLPPGRSGRYFRNDRVVVKPFGIALADGEVVDAEG